MQEKKENEGLVFFWHFLNLVYKNIVLSMPYYLIFNHNALTFRFCYFNFFSACHIWIWQTFTVCHVQFQSFHICLILFPKFPLNFEIKYTCKCCHRILSWHIRKILKIVPLNGRLKKNPNPAIFFKSSFSIFLWLKCVISLFGRSKTFRSRQFSPCCSFLRYSPISLIFFF